MGFSFNWAGVTVPQANVEGNASVQNRSRVDAGAWGQAARGYNRFRADKEYGDILSKYQGVDTGRVQALKADLARLKARNEEIRKQLGM